MAEEGEWTEIRREKKSPPTTNTNNNFKNEIDMSNTMTLKSFFEKKVCIYQFMGKCRGCQFVHMPMDGKFEQLRKIVCDITFISGLEPPRRDILATLRQNINGLEPFLTTCIYSLRNVKCSNVEEGRYVAIDLKYHDNITPIIFCYQDISKCKARVMCGCHFDVEFKFPWNGKITIEKLISIPIAIPNQMPHSTSVADFIAKNLSTDDGTSEISEIPTMVIIPPLDRTKPTPGEPERLIKRIRELEKENAELLARNAELNYMHKIVNISRPRIDLISNNNYLLDDIPYDEFERQVVPKAYKNKVKITSEDESLDDYMIQYGGNRLRHKFT